jgi:acetate kinase
MASDILTLNAGSSSLKFSLWQAETDTKLREIFRGEIEKIGIAPHLSARGPDGRTVIDKKFEKGEPSSATKIFCASSSLGFHSSGRTASRQSAIASCMAGPCSLRRFASTIP